jgi:hypothetical protein
VIVWLELLSGLGRRLKLLQQRPELSRLDRSGNQAGKRHGNPDAGARRVKAESRLLTISRERTGTTWSRPSFLNRQASAACTDWLGSKPISLL